MADRPLRKGAGVDRVEAWGRFLELVQEQSTLVLSTSGPDGAPLATPLFYLPKMASGWQAGLADGTSAVHPPEPEAPDQRTTSGPAVPMWLHWLSSPSSRHSHALSRDGRAAVSIHGCSHSWTEIRGAQLEGVVELVEDPLEREGLLSLYVERFQLDSQHAERMGRSALYRFVPRWIRYLDNRSGAFGRWEF